MKKTKIISAFHACGKTFLCQTIKDKTILDIDSIQYNWINDGNERKRNPNFPANYIKHIKENIGKADYILVSSDAEVRNALTEAGIDFTIVYPDKSLKEEWIGRCFLRGSSTSFCKLIADSWDNLISQMEEESKRHNSFILRHGEYLSDAINFI